MNFRHDYTKCMMTKLLMAYPDRKGGSVIRCDCEKALSIIRAVDNITLGVKKIVYLVGWQYNGHDDKYPAFFEVNDGIKRKVDINAYDSLIWLMKEAKKYNTIVSLHVNFTDAYEDSPLFSDYVNAGALIRNACGKPAKIERYNGKACYKISYKEEWESGLFHKRVDKLLELLPISEAGTLHVDNFQCYVNRKPYVDAQEMQYYREKMVDYLAERGIDITSEFTYREGRGTSLLYGRITRDVTPRRYPIALLDKIPAVWWVDKMSEEEYFDYYPERYCGGMPKDKRIASMLYGNIHGEDIWLKEDWHDEFIKSFYTVNVPFFFLAGKQKKSFGRKYDHIAYADGTVSDTEGKITLNGNVLKEGDRVCMPYMDGIAAYSGDRNTLEIVTDSSAVKVYEITAEGPSEIKDINVNNGKVKFGCKKYTAYYVK